ncbi:beta-lactamase [Mycena filopes]|nr:beta-lactamase [Mycena filopes]
MSSPSFSASQKELLDRILDEAVSSKSTPALFLGVTTAESPIYIHTAGNKLVDDPSSAAIDEHTVYWLCSQTKLITTIAALQLVEQGKIALDTPVEGVLPELANPVVVTEHDEAGRPRATVPAKEKITLQQLLNHTSGLDYFVHGTTPASGVLKAMPEACSHTYMEGEGVATFFEIIKGSLPGMPLRFEPGSDFAYGYSTDCVGFIVERVSGKSLEQYFQDHIFKPLGIRSMSFYLTSELRERLLPLSYRNKNGVLESWKGAPPSNQDPSNVRVHMGGAGLYGSQKDYLALLRHLLQIKVGTAIPGTPMLSRASVESMFAPSLPPAGAASFGSLSDPEGKAQFGLGLAVNTVDMSERRKSGSGTWGGWANTSFFIDPNTGIAVVFGTQVAPTGDERVTKLFDRLERAIYAGL